MTHRSSRLSDADTGGLGDMLLEHPPGTFAPSPASRVTLRALGRHRDLFHGVGVDWGCGVGALAIALARIDTVKEVLGLDLVPENVEAARHNAAAAGVATRIRFFVADSFEPVEPGDAAYLEALRGTLSFVVANPPASVGDDGFSFRRRVLAEARDRLRDQGVVVMQALSAYGPDRVERMVTETGGFEYAGVIERSAAAALDVRDPRMMAFLKTYVDEEAHGGLPYHFSRDPALSQPLDAREALARFRSEGALPWACWQVHLFHRSG